MYCHTAFIVPMSDVMAEIGDTEGAGGVLINNTQVPNTIRTVWGLVGGMAKVISLRFSPELWTAEQAMEWMSKNSVEYVDFQPAEESHYKAPEMAEIKGVEVFEAGTWTDSKGTTFETTEKDLDEVISNWKGKVSEIYLNLDHSPKLTDKVRSALEVVNLGVVSSLIRKGKKLVADFKNVPKQLAELIQAGSLKNRSIEMYLKGFRAFGNKIFQNVMTAVTFTGQEPAVKNLNDNFEVIFDVLMKRDEYHLPKSRENENKIIINLENQSMKIEVDKDEYNNLIQYKASHAEIDKTLEASKGEIATLKKEKDDLSKKVTELETVKGEFETFKKKIDEEKSVNLKKEAEEFIDQAIKDGKVQSKFKDAYVSDYVEKAEKNEDALKLFKDDISSRRKVINLGDTVIGSGGEINIEALDFNDPDAVEEAIQAVAKRDKISWVEAAKKIGVEA